MRFVSALRLRVSAFEGKPWPIVEEKNKLRNQQKKNQEEQAKEKADWNCEKSGNFKNFITNGNVKKRKGQKGNRSPLSPYPNGTSAYAFSAEMEYR